MTIYVIDDHPMIRDAIGLLLRRVTKDHQVVEIERIGLISAAVKKHGQPTMFSLDFMLPDTIGVSGVRQLKNMFPLVPLAVVSASPATSHEVQCIEAGADMYIEKSLGSAEIIASFRALLQTKLDLADEVEPGNILTPRQMQLVKCLDKGLSNRDIAEKLEINEHTVKVHLWRMFKRINVKSRTQAVFHCRQIGVIT